MESLNYYNESEDIFEKSIEANLLLMKYGFGIKYKNFIYNMQKITYDIKFFTEKELRIELDRIIHFNEDPFFTVRENYTNHEDKGMAVNFIIDYVKKHADTIIVRNYDDNTDFSLLIILNQWVQSNMKTFFKCRFQH